MRFLLLLLGLLISSLPAQAQNQVRLCMQVRTQCIPFGSSGNLTTTNASVTIATGGTFQTVLAASTARLSLTIQNNNSISTGTEYCYIFVGSGMATTATSIILAPGGSYQRYMPFVPSDAIQATCTTTSDTLYIDWQ